MSSIEPSRTTRGSIAARLLLGLLVLGVLGYLFVHSLETTRAEPYQVNRANLREWALAVDVAPGAAPNTPVLMLRTDVALVTSLFRQVFLRAMESMSTPAASTIPVVLHGEFESGLSPRMTIDELLAAAREAGLESTGHTPKCLIHRRVSEPGATRQAYGVLMSSPAIERFRALLAASSGGTFDAGALAPVLLVGASDDAFHRWVPWTAGEGDCVAPVEITGA